MTAPYDFDRRGRPLFAGGQSKLYEPTRIDVTSFPDHHTVVKDLGASPELLNRGFLVKVLDIPTELPSDAPEAWQRCVLSVEAALRFSRAPAHTNILPYCHVATDYQPERWHGSVGGRRERPMSFCHIVLPRMRATLARWLAERRPEDTLRPQPRPTEEELTAIGLQMVAAISHLHHLCGEVHLDCTLSNFLVNGITTPNPILVLADFESAMPIAELQRRSTIALQDTTAPPNAALVLSEADETFAAPERRVCPSPKSDVFSVAVTFLAIASLSEGVLVVPDTGDTVMLNCADNTAPHLAAIVHSIMAERYPRFVPLVSLMVDHDARARPDIDFVHDMLQAIQAGRAMGFPHCLEPLQLTLLPVAAMERVVMFPCTYDVDRCAFCGHYTANTLRDPSRKARTECRKNDDMPHIPGQTSAPTEFERVSIPLLASIISRELATMGISATTSASSCGHNRASASSSTLIADNTQTITLRFLYPTLRPANVQPLPQFDVGLRNLVCEGGFALEFWSEQAIVASPGARPASASFSMLSGSSRVTLSDTRGHRARRTFVAAVSPRGGDGTAVGSTGEVIFSAAQRWPAACTQQLHRASRIHSPVPSLLSARSEEATATAFCWLQPGEAFKLPSGDEFLPAPHGGFVFFFSGNYLEPHPCDRYFAIAIPIKRSSPSSADSGAAAAVQSVRRFFSSVASAAVSVARVLTVPPAPGTVVNQPSPGVPPFNVGVSPLNLAALSDVANGMFALRQSAESGAFVPCGLALSAATLRSLGAPPGATKAAALIVQDRGRRRRRDVGPAGGEVPAPVPRRLLPLHGFAFYTEPIAQPGGGGPPQPLLVGASRLHIQFQSTSWCFPPPDGPEGPLAISWLPPFSKGRAMLPGEMDAAAVDGAIPGPVAFQDDDDDWELQPPPFVSMSVSLLAAVGGGTQLVLGLRQTEASDFVYLMIDLP